MATASDSGPSPTPSRRAWLQGLLGGAVLAYAGAILSPIYRYLKSGHRNVKSSETEVREVELGSPEAMRPGSGRAFFFGAQPALLLRRPNGEFNAYLASCTHLGCTIRYAGERDKITCACHAGLYDPGSGRNLDGPPPHPLVALSVQVSGDRLLVRRA